MALEDLLVRTPQAGLTQSLVLMHVPFAEAFRRSGALERALLCAARARGASGLLSQLSVLARQQAGASKIDEFLLLHEMAHFAVDTNQPFTEAAWALAKDKLNDHCATNLEARRNILSGQPLLPGMEFGLAEETPEALEILTRQIADHVAATNGNREVLREICCDFLAVLGFLSWWLGFDVQTADAPTVEHVSQHEVGDIVMLGIRATRLLVVNEFLSQTASHIADSGDPSEMDLKFMEITARQNVVTNLLLGLFDSIMESWTFVPALGREERGQLMDGFRRGVEHVNRRSNELLFTAIENIGLFHRTTDQFEAEMLAAFDRILGGQPATRSQIKSALDATLAELPI